MALVRKVGNWEGINDDDNFDDELVSSDNDENETVGSSNKRDAETAGMKDMKVEAVKKQRKSKKKLTPQLIASNQGIWELIRRAIALNKVKGKWGTEVEIENSIEFPF